ncbi:hypothetical protein CLAVI_000465 [Candidatus Clavichlamydia salmonicola]|uniref:hypothetical protein n=1 Tax=Candidatus Clavichlamydia salmonicola TaxID=469812 RepID=UPI0018915037|nr:hypothetical protein [Candidatus Clavichlamydia salmonicola]MBF5050846.1 hypothetical protein [Candidatus Clavichlamydia salmonicola]
MQKIEKCKKNDEDQAPFFQYFGRLLIFFSFLSIISLNLNSSEITVTPSFFNLKKNILKSAHGSYIVLSHKSHALILLCSIGADQRFFLEEFIVALNSSYYDSLSWNEVIQMGVPHHISYTLSEFDLITEKKNNINFSELTPFEDSLINTLLEIKFKPIPENERKKVQTKTFLKKNWQPRYIENGHLIESTLSQAFRSLKENNHHDKAKPSIEIYLPSNNSTFFPIFIEIIKDGRHIKIRALDSGIVPTYDANL